MGKRGRRRRRREREKNLVLPIKVFWPLVALWETSAFIHQHCHEPALIDRLCMRLVLCVLASLMWDLTRGSEAHNLFQGAKILFLTF